MAQNSNKSKLPSLGLETLRGAVHTMSITLFERECGDLTGCPKWDERITGDAVRRSGRHGKTVHFRFNPNAWRVYSEASSRRVRLGPCDSLAYLNACIVEWCAKEGLNPENIHIGRVDFAIDWRITTGEAHWRKLCDLLIATFNVGHGVKDKHQYYGETQTTMLPKNNKSKWRNFEIERYNKQIQAGGTDVIWRLELRYHWTKDAPGRRKELPEMLAEIQRELQGLVDHYENTLEGMARSLYGAYQSAQATSTRRLNRDTFITLNADRLFSRAQLRRLYDLMGMGRTKMLADNYCKRHDYDFINRFEFQRFIDILCGQIQGWVKNDLSFCFFGEDSEPGKEEEIRVIPENGKSDCSSIQKTQEA